MDFFCNILSKNSMSTYSQGYLMQSHYTASISFSSQSTFSHLFPVCFLRGVDEYPPGKDPCWILHSHVAKMKKGRQRNGRTTKGQKTLRFFRNIILHQKERTHRSDPQMFVRIKAAGWELLDVNQDDLSNSIHLPLAKQQITLTASRTGVTQSRAKHSSHFT